MDNNKKIYLTKEGLAELKKEYDELVSVKRPDVLARVTQARNMGDLSENAEYVAAREELTPEEDYQLQRALDLIHAVHVYQQVTPEH